jgi:carbamoyltransferase
MIILGINAAFHDSAACLVRDGEVLAAAEEERFTRIKHGKRLASCSTYELPYEAIAFCLREAGVTMNEVDHVGYSFDPFLLLPRQRIDQITLPLEPSVHPRGEGDPWEALFLTHIVNAPRHLACGVPHHLLREVWGKGREPRYEWHFVPHHVAHAASAFYPSPFDAAAVMTIDGRGERATTTYFRGDGQLERIGEVAMPHSLGLLFEEVTTYLGFHHASGEYEVMALAAYGGPTYVDIFREIMTYDGDGSYTIVRSDFTKLFGPARRRGERFEERHFDIAHSLQAVLQERVLQLAEWLHGETKLPYLCLAGGVALNCVLNSYLLEHSSFDRIWVQPVAGDAGTALGAALQIDAEQRRGPRWRMAHVALGPEYEDVEIERFLIGAKCPYRKVDDPSAAAADLLLRGKIIGWFQGRMEFGPRALGSRSILASPRDPDTQALLNEIKDREDFRPVAPVVIAEHASEWFEQIDESPYMLFVYRVRPERADAIPAVRHVDGTARVQTVTRAENPRYYDVLAKFHARSGIPVLVNTSFTTNGEPIVESPKDALACFATSPLDALVIGNCVVEK